MSTMNVDVLQAWSEGRMLSSGNLSTDGQKLYSYHILIGERLPDGRRAVYDFTSSGLGGVNVTTSRHVNLAKRCADIIVSDPHEFASITGRTPEENIRRAFIWKDGRAYRPFVPPWVFFGK